MYRKIQSDEIDSATLEATDAEILPVGYHLQTDNTRSNLWVFDEGDEIFLHKQGEQEEVYYVVEGSAKFEVDGEEFVVDADGFVAVEPEAPRRAEALEETRIFIVGAPNVKDDGVVLED